MPAAITPLRYSHRLAQAGESRHNAIETTFNTQVFNLTSLMGPSDGPEWPSDAAWLAFSHNDCACIISDGLSDPWVERDRPITGLGLEVMIQTPDVPFDKEAPMAVTDNWIFPMTAEVSHTLATYPRLCTQLCRGETLAIRFNIEHIKDGRGLVGALLHRSPKHPGLELETGSITLVTATLLTAEEIRWLTRKGESGRQTLLQKLYDAGVGSYSLVHRPSVVSADSA